MTYITIQIPSNVEPGVDSLTFQYEGQELEIVVPPDAKVGDVLRIQVGHDADGNTNENRLDDNTEKEASHNNKNGDRLETNLLKDLGGVDETLDKSAENTTFVSLGNNTVSLELLASTSSQGEGDGTNAMVWPSGLVMAQALTCDASIGYITRYINALSLDDNVVNCLELGSGLGVCGLALAYALSRCKVQARVVLTDRGDGAIQLLNKNIRRNKHLFTSESNSVILEVESLTWGDCQSTKYHFLLGSDLLYNTTESYEPLLRTITHHLHADGILLLAVRWRKPDLEKEFFENAVTLGLEFVLWTEVLDVPELRQRCTCNLGWKEYGDTGCEAFQKFFCETILSISNSSSGHRDTKSLAEITERDMECMNNDEYTKFEECQIQIYVGKFINDKPAAKKTKYI